MSRFTLGRGDRFAEIEPHLALWRWLSKVHENGDGEIVLRTAATTAGDARR